MCVDDGDQGSRRGQSHGGELERVLEARGRFAARPMPPCGPRRQEADQDRQRDRQNGLERDPRAVGEERRNEHHGGPEDEEAGQEAPDRREPVREGLEQGQQRLLERPRGLGRDEARQCDQTGGQDNDVRRPSHAKLAGRRRVQRPARLPHTRRRRLALRPGRGARASLRGHLFGLERVGAGHAVSAPSLRAAKGDAPDRHSWSGQHPGRVKRRPRRRLTAERSAESTPRLHGGRAVARSRPGAASAADPASGSSPPPRSSPPSASM